MGTLASQVLTSAYTQSAPIYIDGRHFSTARPSYQLQPYHYEKAKIPLEIVAPQEGLTTGTAAPSYYYRCYPGILWRVPINVLGGAWPFHYEIVTGPVGMTIGADVGDTDEAVLEWTNPTTGTHSLSVKITDQRGDTDTHSWSLEVTTSNALFVSTTGNNGNAGTSPAAPFLDMQGWWTTGAGARDDATYDNYHVYYRTGTYYTGWDWDTSNNLGQMKMRSKPVVHIPYDGEAVVFDTEGDGGATYTGGSFYLADGPANSKDDAFFGEITFQGACSGNTTTVLDSGTHDGAGNAATLSDSTATWTTNEWVGYTLKNTTDVSQGTVTANDGTTITATLTGGTDDDWDASDAYEIVSSNLWQKSIQLGELDRFNAFGCSFGSQAGAGNAGDNPAHIFLIAARAGNFKDHICASHCDIQDQNNLMLMECYEINKGVLELNTLSNDVADTSRLVYFKENSKNMSVRRNTGKTSANAYLTQIGSSLGEYDMIETCWNDWKVTGSTLPILWMGIEASVNMGNNFNYRNTLTGGTINHDQTAGGGPVEYANNVRQYATGTAGITEDSPLFTVEGTDTDLVATSGLVDAGTNLLTGANRTSYLGLKGHEVD